MKHIALYDADRTDHLIWPEECPAFSETSPALTVFTDFRQHEPSVIDASTLALDAEHIMRRTHQRLKLVLNAGGEFIGILSIDDLSEHELIKKVASGLSRNELLVGEMMQRREHLKVLDYHDLAQMSVKDVLELLQQYGFEHCLVVERERHEIRGIISAREIARQLKIPLSITRPPNFAELYLEAIRR